MRRTRSIVSALALLLATSGFAAAQQTAAAANISNVRYELTFNSATARARSLQVAMTFDVTGSAPVDLALPVWTPGAYEITYYARNISNMQVTGDGRPVDWEKTSFSRWRVNPAGARTVRISFDFKADSLDNAMAWSKADFLLVNGTNVFMFPENGTGFDATVTVRTEPGWKVVTGMTSTGPNTFRESNYHDLVDMPFFIGAMDVDSTRAGERWNRLASYPAGTMDSGERRTVLDQITRMIDRQAEVFGETPWRAYSTLIIYDSSYAGGSALEHQNSHVGVYNPEFIGNPVLPLITGHEIFHAWNVKRLRPADLWPYRYTDEQPTPWLWVSEGITDYYADLTLVRAGIVPAELFYQLTAGKIGTVFDAPPVALEDASLSNWIHPRDGTDAIYYPKGSLAGMLLDIIIRDASDNRRSLDTVMRELYQTAYRQGRGFTAQDWWGAVSKAAGGRDFAEFNEKYIDGREPFPWSTILPLAAMRLRVDSVSEPRIGVNTTGSDAVRVQAVAPGSMAEAAGVQAGDILVSVGDVRVVSQEQFGQEYRERYASGAEGAAIPIVVRRGDQRLVLQGKLHKETRVDVRVEELPGASGKAVRIREGILKGRVDS